MAAKLELRGLLESASYPDKPTKQLLAEIKQVNASIADLKDRGYTREAIADKIKESVAAAKIGYYKQVKALREHSTEAIDKARAKYWDDYHKSASEQILRRDRLRDQYQAMSDDQLKNPRFQEQFLEGKPTINEIEVYRRELRERGLDEYWTGVEKEIADRRLDEPWRESVPEATALIDFYDGVLPGQFRYNLSEDVAQVQDIDVLVNDF